MILNAKNGRISRFFLVRTQNIKEDCPCLYLSANMCVCVCVYIYIYIYIYNYNNTVLQSQSYDVVRVQVFMHV
jgi:hypothetical protein